MISPKRVRELAAYFRKVGLGKQAVCAGSVDRDAGQALHEYWLMLSSRSACTWTEDHNGVWHSACDGAWEFTVSGPSENGARFCHRCGKLIEERAYQEER